MRHASKPSPAILIATAALVFAMTGTGLAASGYLITSRHQIAPRVLRSLHGKPGPIGPAGAAGVTGATGATGATGVFAASDITIATGPAVALCASPGGTCQIGISTAICPPGFLAISGGWTSDVPDGLPSISVANSPTSWEVVFTNQAAVPDSFTAVVVCAA